MFGIRNETRSYINRTTPVIEGLEKRTNEIKNTVDIIGIALHGKVEWEIICAETEKKIEAERWKKDVARFKRELIAPIFMVTLLIITYLLTY